MAATAASLTKYSASAVTAATAAVAEAAPVERVHITLQTLLKMMQHARDASAPQSATGQLLGMDTGEGVLEVTDTFPFATSIQDDAEQEEYQLDMVKLLRDVNVDHCTVGWYQVCAFDGPISASLIEAQIAYQASVPNCVLLVLDHALSVNGAPALRALRLRDDFVRAFRERRSRAVAEFVGLAMFDELPMHVRLTAPDRMLLSQLLSDGQLPDMGAATTPELALHELSAMCDSVSAAAEDVLAETGRLAYNLRSTTKQQQALAAQLHRLRTENAQRVQAGEEPLPIATVLANFRVQAEPSRIPALIASSNLHLLLDELPVASVAADAASSAVGTSSEDAKLDEHGEDALDDAYDAISSAESADNMDIDAEDP